MEVTFVRNYSYDEVGLLIGPEVGNVTILRNVFDSGIKAAIIFGHCTNYKILNNVFKSCGLGDKPATLRIVEEARDILFDGNIIIASERSSFLLRMSHGTPVSRNVQFKNNCWWQPSGSIALAFKDLNRGSYQFHAFQQYSTVSNNIFVDPGLKEDYTTDESSPCANIGIITSDDLPLKKLEAPKGLKVRE